MKLLSVTGAAGLAGCFGGDGDSDDGNGDDTGDTDGDLPDEVEVWAWDDPALQPVREGQAEEFEERHDVSFQWEVFPFADYLPNMTTAIAGDNAPDSGAFSVVWVPEMGHEGVLANVEEEFDVDPDDFVEAAARNSSYDGEMICVPWFHDCRFLGIDQGAFDEAGIDVPDPHSTPDLENDFEEWLFDLQEEFGDGPVFVMDAREGFEALFLSNGGRYFDEDVTECTLNEPEVVEVAEFVQRHINEEETMAVRSPDAATDPIEDFLAGEMQMYYSGLWHHERLEDSDIEWQWNPMPAGPQNEESHTWSAGVFYGCPVAGGASPAAGKAWAEYITSDEIQGRVAPETGLFPATNAAYETDEFREFVEDNPAMETAEQVIEETVPFPEHAEFPSMWEEMTRHAERMWFDDEDPQTVLDELAETIEGMM